jgi:hypothetical protein
MKACRGSRDITSLILNLGTRWRLVVKFTPRLLHPWERNPEMHGGGDWVGLIGAMDFGRREKPFILSRIRTPNRPDRSLLTIPMKLSIINEQGCRREHGRGLFWCYSPAISWMAWGKAWKTYQDGLPSDRRLGQRSRNANHGKKSRCSTVSSALAHASRRKLQPSDCGHWGVTHGDAVSYVKSITGTHTYRMLFCGMRHCIVWHELPSVSAIFR